MGSTVSRSLRAGTPPSTLKDTALHRKVEAEVLCSEVLQWQNPKRNGVWDFTRSYGSHSLTHSKAVMVNELDMKDWPSFKLTKTSRVLPRDKGKI